MESCCRAIPATDVATTDGRDALVGSALIMDPREPVYDDDGTYAAIYRWQRRCFWMAEPCILLNNVITVNKDSGYYYQRIC